MSDVKRNILGFTLITQGDGDDMSLVTAPVLPGWKSPSATESTLQKEGVYTVCTLARCTCAGVRVPATSHQAAGGHSHTLLRAPSQLACNLNERQKLANTRDLAPRVDTANMMCFLRRPPACPC